MMTNTKLTAETITYSQIAALRSEAVDAQDTVQIVMCERAMGEDIDTDDWDVSGQERARVARIAGLTVEQAQAECARAIAANV